MELRNKSELDTCNERQRSVFFSLGSSVSGRGRCGDFVVGFGRYFREVVLLGEEARRRRFLGVFRFPEIFGVCS